MCFCNQSQFVVGSDVRCIFVHICSSLTTRKVAWCIILVVSVWMYVCLSDDNFRQPRCRKFIFAHVVYFQGIWIKFVYEGHRVKVRVTREKNVKSYPATPTFNWEHVYHCRDSERITSMKGGIQMSQWEILCVISVTDQTNTESPQGTGLLWMFICLPYVTKCTHCGWLALD